VLLDAWAMRFLILSVSFLLAAADPEPARDWRRFRLTDPEVRDTYKRVHAQIGHYRSATDAEITKGSVPVPPSAEEWTALSFYKFNGYGIINAYLRGDNEPAQVYPPEVMQCLVELSVSGLNKLPESQAGPGPDRLPRRPVPAVHHRHLCRGEAGRRTGIPQQFAGPGGGHEVHKEGEPPGASQGSVYHMVTKWMALTMDKGMSEEEKEVLFVPGCRFVVTKRAPRRLDRDHDGGDALSRVPAFIRWAGGTKSTRLSPAGFHTRSRPPSRSTRCFATDSPNPLDDSPPVGTALSRTPWRNSFPRSSGVRPGPSSSILQTIEADSGLHADPIRFPGSENLTALRVDCPSPPRRRRGRC